MSWLRQGFFDTFQIRQFWEHTFHCRFAPPPVDWLESGGALCSGEEDLESVQTELLDVSNLRPEYNIYKAVYALAYALDDMLLCQPGRGPFRGHSCGSLQKLEAWQVRFQLSLNLYYFQSNHVVLKFTHKLNNFYDCLYWRASFEPKMLYLNVC